MQRLTERVGYKGVQGVLGYRGVWSTEESKQGGVGYRSEQTGGLGVQR